MRPVPIQPSRASRSFAVLHQSLSIISVCKRLHLRSLANVESTLVDRRAARCAIDCAPCARPDHVGCAAHDRPKGLHSGSCKRLQRLRRLGGDDGPAHVRADGRSTGRSGYGSTASAQSGWAGSRALLAESELGALLCFDMTNIRYITATHIGTWAQDKLNRFCLLPQGDEPIMWDFGSAARHHQLYNPWLGDGRSRAGISTLRGAMAPAGRAGRERRREDPRRARASATCSRSRSASTRSSPPVLFALQDAGIEVVDGQQLMQEARVIKTAGRDHAAQHRLHDGRRRLRRALPRRCGPGCARTSASGSSTRSLYDMGSEFVEGVNAISGERCNPHPHVYTDRAAAPRRPGLLRHPAQLHGLPHLLLPHVRGR